MSRATQRRGLIASRRRIRQIHCYHHLYKGSFEMRSLNLDQLRTLQAVTEGRSFSAAARRLNLSQPAVSVQVRELERRFGVKLVERLGKQAHATAPGRELVEAAKEIFKACERAEQAMRRFRDGWLGSVHVGTTNTALMYDLPAILGKLRLGHPGLDLHVTTMPTRDSIEQVIQNKIDLALVTMPVENRQLRITPLRWQTLVAIFPPDTHDVPQEITPDYVARQPLLIEHTVGAVHALIMRWLSQHLPLPRPPMHLGTIEALKIAVRSNLGMSIIPDVAVAADASGLIVRPLRPAVPCTLALVEHRNKPNEPAQEIVRNALLTLRQNRATLTGAGSRRRTQRSGRRVAERR
jgi:DNA-binding transcriptional LysR family regulator